MHPTAGSNTTTACPGGRTGTSRAPLRQPLEGTPRRAGPSYALPGQAAPNGSGVNQTQPRGSSSQCRKGSSSECRLTRSVHPREPGSSAQCPTTQCQVHVISHAYPSSIAQFDLDVVLQLPSRPWVVRCRPAMCGSSPTVRLSHTPWITHLRAVASSHPAQVGPRASWCLLRG